MTKEEYKKRIERAMYRFEHKPKWLKKRATKNYAFENWKKNQPIPAESDKPKVA